MCSQIVDTLLEFITLTPLYDTSSKQFINKPVASLIPVAVSIYSFITIYLFILQQFYYYDIVQNISTLKSVFVFFVSR